MNTVNARYFADQRHRDEVIAMGVSILASTPAQESVFKITYEDFVAALPKDGRLPIFNYGEGAEVTAARLGEKDPQRFKVSAEVSETTMTETMKFFRDNMTVRVTENGVTRRVKAIPQMFAIPGAVNGSGKPFAHFDIVFSNKVFVPELGEWRALDRRTLFFLAPIARLVAANTLAYGMRTRLGYDAKVENGMVRLGMPQEVQKELSTQSPKIEQKLKEWSGPIPNGKKQRQASQRKRRRKANFAIREKNIASPTREKLQAEVRQVFEKHQFELKQLPRVKHQPQATMDDARRVTREAAQRRLSVNCDCSPMGVLQETLRKDGLDGVKVDPRLIVEANRDVFGKNAHYYGFARQQHGTQERFHNERDGDPLLRSFAEFKEQLKSTIITQLKTELAALLKDELKTTVLAELKTELASVLGASFTAPQARPVVFETAKDAANALRGMRKRRAHWEAVKAFFLGGSGDRWGNAEKAFREARRPTHRVNSSDVVIILRSLDAKPRDNKRFLKALLKAGSPHLVLTDSKEKIDDLLKQYQSFQQTQKHSQQR